MWTVKVESDFAAAHFLTHYHGKCERLHGHNYRVVVWARGNNLTEGGMLIDFGHLKSALRTVLEKIDHTNLNDMPVFSGDPSAERIAQYIFTRMEEELPAYSVDPTLLWAVDAYETPLTMARYER
ncbi:MAG: 6-carboxytetrahydropterin synthase QueD [Spirochaetaceae bacterium]|jgi:6-pyruvoyltetrahydropterin/6-carboxytetrahydropterin synthase|nr:6-carboxytetrahydropterin synthase QueD [Spirochaetaceae bacterium]